MVKSRKEEQEEKEEEEEEKKNEKVLQLWSPKKLQRDYITSDPSATCGPSGKVTDSEGHVLNDPTSTLGPSRDPTDPSASGVTTEPIDPNRCLRPLQRARERREARLKKESHAHAEFDPDPHVPSAKPGSQRSSVSSAWEQERVHLSCDRCNNKLTDTDWSKIRSEGLGHLREVQRPLRLRCSPCIDSVARALTRSTRPHEFR